MNRLCIRARIMCEQWALTQRLRCSRWRTEWTRRCDKWRQEQTQRCDRWRQEQTQRCDRWEQEQSRQCADWGPFSFLCLLWVAITTWVCRAWVTVTTTVCELWVTVISWICDLWTWVGTVLCDLWTLVTVLVCRAWALVFDWICSVVCLIRRLLAPNEYRISKSECIYAWTAAYLIEEDVDRCTLHITLRIRLVPDAGVSSQDIANCVARWEPAIEQAWTRRFPILLQDGNCRCRSYSVEVDVQFVTSGEHHTVTVHPGSGRADMANWYFNSTGGTAAHESGHMFGNPDEYADKNCPSRVVTADGSIMQNSQTGTVKERHYGGFADWVSNRTCCHYAVGSSEG